MHKSIRTRLWIGGVTFIAVLAFFYPFILPPETVDEQSVARQNALSPVPDFARYRKITEKKKAFFDYLKPEVEKQNHQILLKRSALFMLREKTLNQEVVGASQFRYLYEICVEYDVDCSSLDTHVFDELLLKVDIIPFELVLVQAANESAWGTSRFAQKGYNFFGLWCFRKGCGFVPRQRDEGTHHEVAKFSSLDQAVSRYLNNLNRHYAYDELRTIRASLRNNQQPVTAEALMEGLLSYSERGQAYIEELQAMIRINRKYM